MALKIENGEAFHAPDFVSTPIDVVAAGGKRINLIKPIEFEGRTIEEITLRPLKVKDMVAVQRMGGDQADMTFNLLARSADLPREAIDELFIPDAEILVLEVDRLTGKSIPENPKPS